MPRSLLLTATSRSIHTTQANACTVLSVVWNPQHLNRRQVMVVYGSVAKKEMTLNLQKTSRRSAPAAGLHFIQYAF
jgi:hypothetical protein